MKKTLAVVLTLALVLALTSVSAFAADSQTGDGTIAYTTGGGPGIIPDPEDPPNPTDPEDIRYNVRGLDFGSHSLDDNTITRTYDSLVAASTIPGQTTGITIQNTDPDGWHVTVSRTDFTIGALTVLTGSALTLIPTVPDAKNPNPKPFDGALGAPTGLESKVVNSAATTVLTAAAGNGIGIWSALWSGTLLVPANTAKIGDAKSTMTWSVVVGP